MNQKTFYNLFKDKPDLFNGNIGLVRFILENYEETRDSDASLMAYFIILKYNCDPTTISYSEGLARYTSIFKTVERCRRKVQRIQNVSY